MTFINYLTEAPGALQRVELKYRKTSDGVYQVYKDKEFVGFITKDGFDHLQYTAEIEYGDFKESSQFDNLKGAKAWFVATVPLQKKEDTKYRVYHSSYTRAIQEVEKYAKKLGFKFDEDGQEGEQLAQDVGLGPARPKEGMTNKFSFELYKNNHLQRKHLQVQIYFDGDTYELNMYVL